MTEALMMGRIILALVLCAWALGVCIGRPLAVPSYLLRALNIATGGVFGALRGGRAQVSSGTRTRIMRARRARRQRGEGARAHREAPILARTWVAPDGARPRGRARHAEEPVSADRPRAIEAVVRPARPAKSPADDETPPPLV